MSKLSDLVAELEKKQNDAAGLRHKDLPSWNSARKIYRDALENAAPQLFAAAKALGMARTALRDCVSYRVIDPAAEALPAIDKALDA